MRTLGIIAILCGCAGAAIVDRIAVVVGKNVITETEVLQELRLTQFLNHQPLDLGPEQRRAAAERLVDQQLIRNEMEISAFPQPAASEAGGMLRSYRQEHYAGEAELRAALQKYGITEDQLKQHLLWQLTAMRFTDRRFSVGLPVPSAAAAGSANRVAPGAEPSAKKPDRATAGANRMAPESEAAADGGDVDRQLEAWLKQARSATRVQFKKDAFQ